MFFISFEELINEEKKRNKLKVKSNIGNRIDTGFECSQLVSIALNKNIQCFFFYLFFFPLIIIIIIII